MNLLAPALLAVIAWLPHATHHSRRLQLSFIPVASTYCLVLECLNRWVAPFATNCPGVCLCRITVHITGPLSVTWVSERTTLGGSDASDCNRTHSLEYPAELRQLSTNDLNPGTSVPSASRRPSLSPASANILANCSEESTSSRVSVWRAAFLI